MSQSNSIAIRFGSRASEGTDIAAVIRSAWPEADVRAELDGSGAVAGYAVHLTFDDPDRCADAAFDLCHQLRELGFPFEVGG